MGFLAPIASAVGGFLGFSGTAATVAGTAAMGFGVASAVNKDVRRIALPVLGGMATGGALAGASAGTIGGVSSGALAGGVLGAETGIKLNEAAKMKQQQENYYNQKRSLIARQEADISQRNAETAKKAKIAQAAQASALSIETERMARLQQRMLRGRRRGWNDDDYYGSLNALLG